MGHGPQTGPDRPLPSQGGRSHHDDHLPLRYGPESPPPISLKSNNASTGGFNPTWHTRDDNMDNIDPSSPKCRRTRGAQRYIFRKTLIIAMTIEEKQHEIRGIRRYRKIGSTVMPRSSTSATNFLPSTSLKTRATSSKAARAVYGSTHRSTTRAKCISRPTPTPSSSRASYHCSSVCSTTTPAGDTRRRPTFHQRHRPWRTPLAHPLKRPLGNGGSRCVCMPWHSKPNRNHKEN